MASFPLASSNRFLIAQENLKLYVGKSNSLGLYQTLNCSLSNSCYPSVSLPLLKVNYSFCKSRHSSIKVKSLINEKGNVEPHLEKRHNYFTGRKFSLRLRPRFRLFSKSLKRLPVRSMLNGLQTFLRKNARRVTLTTCLSIVFGLCLLFLKLTAIQSPKAVPYSDLISSLHNGVVEKVLFEEGTRRIYYNTNSLTTKHTQPSEDAVLVPGQEVFDASANNAVASNRKAGRSFLAKMSRGRASNPAWQFSTRKIDHDEGYLLTLMREKGTSYGSAPQSVLLSIRSLLITVLTLWVPLTPLMWLLYRQLSAANSPARKRRSNNQLIQFDDVEGVDAAKTELMEVSLLLLAFYK